MQSQAVSKAKQGSVRVHAHPRTAARRARVLPPVAQADSSSSSSNSSSSSSTTSSSSGGGDTSSGETATKEKSSSSGKQEWTPPPLDPNTPSPIFGGSTGGLLRMAQVEEFYVITWTSKKEQLFEMPTGGSAIMREGDNLLKLARKEQCLALLSQLRTKYRINGQIYRVFPSGEVQHLHPKDGVYPEKVNKGRGQVNSVSRSIGENPDPSQVKFTGKETFDE